MKASWKEWTMQNIKLQLAKSIQNYLNEKMCHVHICKPFGIEIL